MWKRILNKQKSIKSSLVILLILSSIIPLLISGVISYSVVNSLISDEMTANFEMTNIHKIDEVNSLIASLERVMDDLSGSETTKAYLQVKDSRDSELNYISLVRLTEKIESVIYQQGNCIDGINFVWMDGTTPITRYNSYDSFLTLNRLKEEPYSQMLENTPSIRWFFEEDKIYLYKSIYSPISDDTIGSIIIKVNSDYLRKLMDTGKNTYSCLVAENGVVLHTDMAFAEDDADELTNLIPFSEKEKKTFTQEEKGYIIAAGRLDHVDVMMADIASLNEIIDTRESFAYSMIFSSVFAIGFASFFATFISIHFRRLI